MKELIKYENIVMLYLQNEYLDTNIIQIKD